MYCRAAQAEELTVQRSTFIKFIQHLAREKVCYDVILPTLPSRRTCAHAFTFAMDSRSRPRPSALKLGTRMTMSTYVTCGGNHSLPSVLTLAPTRTRT